MTDVQCLYVVVELARVVCHDFCSHFIFIYTKCIGYVSNLYSEIKGIVAFIIVTARKNHPSSYRFTQANSKDSWTILELDFPDSS